MIIKLNCLIYSRLFIFCHLHKIFTSKNNIGFILVVQYFWITLNEFHQKLCSPCKRREKWRFAVYTMKSFHSGQPLPLFAFHPHGFIHYFQVTFHNLSDCCLLWMTWITDRFVPTWRDKHSINYDCLSLWRK